MILLQDNQTIYNVARAGMALGLNAGGEVVFDPPAVLLYLTCDPYNNWWGRCTSEPVLHQQQPCPVNRPFPLRNEEMFTLSSHSLKVFLDTGDSLPELSLREEYWQWLASALHKPILDALRLLPEHTAERSRRAEVLDLLARLLPEKLPSLSPTLRDYLAAKALQAVLVDRAYGYDHAPDTADEPGQFVRNAVQFAALTAELETTLQFDDSLALEAKAARIRLLFAWATAKCSLTEEQCNELLRGMIREDLMSLIFGLGPLDDLLLTEGIQDIMIQPSLKILIELKGLIIDSGRRLLSVAQARLLIEKIVTASGGRIDQSSPLADARLSDGSRLNAVIEPISLYGPVLTIRRHASKRFTIEDLIQADTLPRNVALFLQACVLARKNFVISGETGAGKTTILTVLATFIPTAERIVTIEDTPEINLQHENLVALKTRPANQEGTGEITPQRLVRNALRMNPHRIILGEARGAEIVDVLTAMNTGHDGSFTTLHANSAEEVISRMVVLANQAGSDKLAEATLRQMIGSAVHCLVHVAKAADGVRRITSIAEVVGVDEKTNQMITHPIYKFPRNGNRLRFTGYVPTFVEELLKTGVVTAEALF